MKLERLHLKVSGRVQGVGFRYCTVQAAIALSVVGWVKNRSDGAVEVMVEGQRTQLELLLEWCRKGPRGASVLSVEVLEREEIGMLTFSSFEIER